MLESLFTHHLVLYHCPFGILYKIIKNREQIIVKIVPGKYCLYKNTITVAKISSSVKTNTYTKEG